MTTLPKLILSLFRGRHDHIAVATASGFEPSACAPADILIERHLVGGQSYGFYVLTADSRVWCTCVDFDNKPDAPNPHFESQAVALHTALRGYELFPVMEVSQSGSGYHVWLFFAEPVPAFMVRAWWRGVEGKMGVKFKEVFPKQDRLAGKGLGNLVRYPLWNKSHFVDPEDGFAKLDAAETLAGVVRVGAGDLPLLAHQLGMGELRGEPAPTVVVAAGGDGLFPLRVQKLVERKHTLLARRWGGDAQGMKDPSNSALAMSIAVELVRLYVPTPEIASALRYWCQQRGAEKGQRDDWINLTVTKAYDFIITRAESPSTDATTFESACIAYIDQMEKGTHGTMPSGLAELDRSIDGVSPGEMAIIAARPGHGKSALAFQWLASAARRGVKGLLVSEEMGAVEIGKRRLLSITELDQERWGSAVAKQLKTEVRTYHEGVAPCYIVEGCNTIDRVEEVVDQFVGVHEVGIVAVDYLQLLTGRNADRYEIVTEMSRRLKQCAKRNHIPLLVLSQLNREVEKRTDNEPKLSDLRESGQLEQDADLILFLQWPHKFSQNADPALYRIYCAKRRNGPIRESRIETRFNAARQEIGAGYGGEP